MVNTRWHVKEMVGDMEDIEREEDKLLKIFLKVSLPWGCWCTTSANVELSRRNEFVTGVGGESFLWYILLPLG